MAGDSTREFLRHVALFANLDDESLDALAGFAFEKTFETGATIVEEGHIGNGVYVVVSGRVEVLKFAGTNHEEALATLGAGEPFGELALLGEWKRTATVRAIEDTHCLGIDRWLFLAHLQRDPKLALKMLEVVTERLVRADERLGAR